MERQDSLEEEVSGEEGFRNGEEEGGGRRGQRTKKQSADSSDGGEGPDVGIGECLIGETNVSLAGLGLRVRTPIPLHSRIPSATLAWSS